MRVGPTSCLSLNNSLPYCLQLTAIFLTYLLFYSFYLSFFSVFFYGALCWQDNAPQQKGSKTTRSPHHKTLATSLSSSRSQPTHTLSLSLSLRLSESVLALCRLDRCSSHGQQGETRSRIQVHRRFQLGTRANGFRLSRLLHRLQREHHTRRIRLESALRWGEPVRWPWPDCSRQQIRFGGKSP